MTTKEHFFFSQYMIKCTMIGCWESTQSANNVSQDVPMTSHSTSPGRLIKNLFDHPHPGEVLIWCLGDVPKWPTLDVVIWRPRHVPRRLIWEVHRTSPTQPYCGVICWISLKFFFYFYFGTCLNEQIYLKPIQYSRCI